MFKNKTHLVSWIFFFKIYCVVQYAWSLCVHTPQHACGGQRTALFLPFPVLRIKPGFCSKPLYPPSHLTSPVFFFNWSILITPNSGLRLAYSCMHVAYFACFFPIRSSLFPIPLFLCSFLFCINLRSTFINKITYFFACLGSTCGMNFSTCFSQSGLVSVMIPYIFLQITWSFL